MSLWNPFAFTPTGQAVAPVAPPALRVMDGQATAQQLAHAQDAFYRFCASARLSAVPNPTEIGALPDGSRYRITTVGVQTIMQLWPVDAGADVNEDRGILVAVSFGGSPTGNPVFYTPKLTSSGKVVWGARALRPGEALLPFPAPVPSLYSPLSEAATRGTDYLLRLRSNTPVSYGVQRFVEKGAVFVSQLPPGNKAVYFYPNQLSQGFDPFFYNAATNDGGPVFVGNAKPPIVARDLVINSTPIPMGSLDGFLVNGNVALALSSTQPKVAAALINVDAPAVARPWGGLPPPGAPGHAPAYIDAWFAPMYPVTLRPSFYGGIAISNAVVAEQKLARSGPQPTKVAEFSVNSAGTSVALSTYDELVDADEDVVPPNAKIVLKNGLDGAVNYRFSSGPGGRELEVPVRATTVNGVVGTHVDTMEAFYETYIGSYSRKEEQRFTRRSIKQLMYNRTNGALHVVDEVSELSYEAVHTADVHYESHGRPRAYGFSQNAHQFTAFREFTRTLRDNGVSVLQTVHVRAEETQDCTDSWAAHGFDITSSASVSVSVHNKNLVQYDPTIGMLCYIEEVVEYATTPTREYHGNSSGVSDVVGDRGVLPVPNIWLVVEISGVPLRRIPIKIKDDARPTKKAEAAMRYVAAAGATPEGADVAFQAGWINDASTFVRGDALDQENVPSGVRVEGPNYYWGGATYSRCAVPCMSDAFPFISAYAADPIAPAGVLRVELDDETYTPSDPFTFLVSANGVVDGQDVFPVTPARGATVVPV